jgi:transcriptional regulator GlxA family with amidase domain
MNFDIVVFPQVEELDFVGPWDMVTMWQQVADGPKTCLIIAERQEPVACAKGLSVNPHVSFAECPALDILLVPGGGQGTRAEVSNPRMLEFVSAQAQSCKAVLSVCTGSFGLHAVGLLSGKKATTHWSSLDRLRALGDVDVIEARFTQDGNIWCSAGVSAGMDMALRFIVDFAGEDAAGKVQFAAEYYPLGSDYGDSRRHAKAPAYIRDA